MVLSYRAGNYLNIIITSNAELVSNSGPVYSKSLKSHFIVTRRAYRLFWEHQTRFPQTAVTTHEHHIYIDCFVWFFSPFCRYTLHISLQQCFFICSKETIPHHRWWAALTSPAWRMWILFLPPDWLSTDRQTDMKKFADDYLVWMVCVPGGKRLLKSGHRSYFWKTKVFFFLHTKKRWRIFMLFASLAFRKTRIYLSVLLRVLFFLWRPKGF